MSEKNMMDLDLQIEMVKNKLEWMKKKNYVGTTIEKDILVDVADPNLLVSKL